MTRPTSSELNQVKQLTEWIQTSKEEKLKSEEKNENQ